MEGITLVRGDLGVLLREVLTEDACPACLAVTNGLDRFFRWFFIETYGSLPTVERLARGGFCREHSRRILSHPSGYLVSSTYDVALREYRQRLERSLSSVDATPTSRSRKRVGQVLQRLGRFLGVLPRDSSVASPLHEVVDCPACEIQQFYELHVIHQLVWNLHDEELRSRYRASHGLCRHHLAQALEISDKETKVFLMEHHLGKVEQVLAELTEYFRKLDYRNAHEPKGREQTAWRRAITLYDGHRYLRS